MNQRPEFLLQTIKSIEDVLTFGKYKGKTIEWIVTNNPGYILWAVDAEYLEVPDDIYHDAEINDRMGDDDWTQEPSMWDEPPY